MFCALLRIFLPSVFRIVSLTLHCALHCIA